VVYTTASDGTNYPNWITSIDNESITVYTSALADADLYTVSYTSNIYISNENHDPVAAPLVVTDTAYTIKIECYMPTDPSDIPLITIAPSYDLWTSFTFRYTDRTNTYGCNFNTYIYLTSDTINPVAQNGVADTSETGTTPKIDL